MSYGAGLLAALGEPRPNETELAHKTTTVNTGTSIEAYCTCGFSMESAGADESSKAAVAAFAKGHAGGAK